MGSESTTTASGREPDGGNPIPMPSGHLRLTTRDGELVVGDARVTIPVGAHVLDAPSWDLLDAEMRRLQELETRITAENRSLRETASSWQPGWRTMAITLAVGLAGGAYAYYRIAD